MLNEKVWMNFSGIYEEQSFWRDYSFEQVDIKDLSGTNCYCDDLAIEKIRSKIAEFTGHGLHFLDSGNYHYMSRIWLEKIEESFCLIVFDHHTDMQLPAFGGILSCGGWIAASMDELPNLRQVIVIGPDQASIDMVEPEFRERVTWFSQEKLEECGSDAVIEELKRIILRFPLYISVDKDILAEQEIKTNWGQGSVRWAELQQYLEILGRRAHECEVAILGMDVCGESDSAHPESIEESDWLNQQLICCWNNFFDRE